MLNLEAISILLFFRYSISLPLETFIIETRKSILLNSFLQKFHPCQPSLITNHRSNIQFLSSHAAAMFIFNLPHKCENPNNPNNLFSNRQKIATYPIYLGHQYIAKFNLPVCKLNLLFYSTKQRAFTKNLDFWFTNIFLPQTNNSNEFSIENHNHVPSRTVYCSNRTFYLLLNDKINANSNSFQIIPDAMIRFSRFWTISSIPTNSDFLKPKLSSIIQFSTKRCEKQESYCYPTYLLDEWTCRTREKLAYICLSM